MFYYTLVTDSSSKYYTNATWFKNVSDDTFTSRALIGPCIVQLFVMNQDQFSNESMYILIYKNSFLKKMYEL